MLLILLCVGTAGCVGPASSDSDYRADVGNTATSAITAVESAQLTVEAVVAGRATGPYVRRRLTEDEQLLQSTIVSFSSVQPPSADMDALRSDVLTTLEAASATLSELRIAAFRGSYDRLADLARPLPDIASSLGRFEDVGMT